MLELEEAQQRILSAVTPLSVESISLGKAAGRFLADTIKASANLPSFDNSAMDGYAVRAGDVAGAGPGGPVALRRVGTAAAGQVFSAEVRPGTCVRVFTGSPLPAGADAVVMQEEAQADTQEAQLIWFRDAARLWENVRLAGEDLKQGTPVTRPGDPLTAGRLGLLAALGLGEVSCFRQPIVGLLATGDELLDSGSPLSPGKIYESNRVSLASLVTRAGGVAKIFPLVKDTLSATCKALEAALTQCDLVLTTGGVSVGELDLVKSAFQKLDGELDLWKIAIKPGKPFGFGRWREKFWFGLPGNPVSAFVTFLLLVRPAVLRCQGASRFSLPVRQGSLAESLVNRGDRRHFVRVMVDDLARVRSAGGQASHILSSLAVANGLADVPPHSVLAAGSPINVLSWE